MLMAGAVFEARLGAAATTAVKELLDLPLTHAAEEVMESSSDWPRTWQCVPQLSVSDPLLPEALTLGARSSA